MKNEIERLTNEMLDGIHNALKATQILAFEFGVKPALNVNMMLQIMLGSLEEQSDETLVKKMVEFVETRLQQINQEPENAVKDLLNGLNISLN